MVVQFKYYSARIVILLILFLFSHINIAQIVRYGKPFIKNYTRSDYLAGQQNWMITENKDGRLFFANNEGLLEFDGQNWNIYPISNGIIIRSLLIDDNNRIYVGGYNEFGYFEADERGSLSYHSLMELLSPEYRDFEEIWRIHNTPEGLVFQSYSQLIILKDGAVKVIPAPGIFHFSFYINGQLLLVDKTEGLLRFTMGNFYPLIGTDLLKGHEIIAVIPFGNQYLFATAEMGLYVYNGNTLKEWINPASVFLKKNQVFSGERINADLLAFGTIQDGLLICTNEGKIIQKINREKGLQNNTVLCIMKDSFGNLWLGTDNGIDYLEINSPLSIISNDVGISAGYTAILHNGILYLGTNQGVFYKKWDSYISDPADNRFKIIETTRGQVWTLQEFDNRIFCGHHNGTFIIIDSSARKISDIPGAWTFINPAGHPDKIIGGTYSGLVLLKKTGDNWNFNTKIKGFDESSRELEMAGENTIWMTHGYKGVFSISLNQMLDSVTQVGFYDENKGFNNRFGIRVTKIKGQNIFTTSDGTYIYNRNNDLFEPYTSLNESLKLEGIKKLTEDSKGNIWYFSGEQIGVMRIQEDGNYVNINLPFKQLTGGFIGGFEFVYAINVSHVLIGTENGFIHYNPSQFKNYQKPFFVYINKVSVFRPDSIVFSGHTPPSGQRNASIKFRKNALYFSFSANDFENPEKTEFSTFMEGFDSDWTIWDTRLTREFTNLYEGDYTFYVKARNIYGVETETATFSVSIKPPWERSIAAYIMYAVIGFVLIGIALILIRKKIEKANQKEKERQQKKFKEREEKLQREALEAEKEIIRLRNEKLSEQMTMKDKELANSTLEMIQKNKLLNKIKNDLKKLNNSASNNELKNQIHNLIKKINKEVDAEKQWEVFETHFENVHEAFLKRLKSQFPELSP
ncbi:MAG: hypothetical protein JW731_10925, partial [Bacteroidales bacterium]|nr:hypothetical protein [Bacteroidales bacterium]